MAYRNTAIDLARRRKRGNGLRRPGQDVLATAACAAVNDDEDDDDDRCSPCCSKEEETNATTLPLLRRSSTAWSSTATLSRSSSGSSLSLSSVVERGYDSTVAREKSKTVWLFPNVWNNMIRTINFQLQGMTEDFSKSGLPWSGQQCQSFVAGGTGILYCLPSVSIAVVAAACTCAGNDVHVLSSSFPLTLRRMEQAAWILQAFLSVMADYVHIHHDSVFHGLDRYYASFNTVAMLIRAAFHLPGVTMLVLGCPPIACFLLANRAKTMATAGGGGDSNHYLQQWHWCHGGWHVTGSIAVTLAVYWMHGSDDGNAC